VLVRCAQSVCACASRVKGRRATSPSGQGLGIVSSFRIRCGSSCQHPAIKLARHGGKRRLKSLVDKRTMAANMYRVGGKCACVRACGKHFL